MLLQIYSIQINMVLKGKHLISCPCTNFYFFLLVMSKTICPFLTHHDNMKYDNLCGVGLMYFIFMHFHITFLELLVSRLVIN